MDISDVYLRSLMFYDFKRGGLATACQDDITAAFGPDIVSVRTWQRPWLRRFRDDNFDLTDVQRPGSPRLWSDDSIRQVVENSTRSTSREIASTVGCSNLTVFTRLKKMNKVNILPHIVPHELSENQLRKGLAPVRYCHFRWKMRLSEKTLPLGRQRKHMWTIRFCARTPTQGYGVCMVGEWKVLYTGKLYCIDLL